MKTFILTCAIPGSGKSTWAEEYRLTHPHTFVVASDEIRKELGGAYQNFENEKEVWEKYFNDIIKYRDYYDDVTVIGDSTNIINKHRLFYGENVKGFDKKILVIFRKSMDTVLKTNKQRDAGRHVPEDVIKHMFEIWEEPSPEVLALYDEVIEVKEWFKADDVKDEFHYQ